ncbi:MAG: hypothetical protein NTW28_12230 [Candidatus Solibacter sp.]|nr:hypothetical protein [Candidatus Solibacter sp.]
MKLTMDHTQRLNLHALLGAQRADVGSIRAIWAVQDKIASCSAHIRANMRTAVFLFLTLRFAAIAADAHSPREQFCMILLGSARVIDGGPIAHVTPLCRCPKPRAVS